MSHGRCLGVCVSSASHHAPVTSYSACGPPPSVVAAISALSAAAAGAPQGCHGTTSPLDGQQSNDQMTIFGLHPAAYSQSKTETPENVATLKEINFLRDKNMKRLLCLLYY